MATLCATLVQLGIAELGREQFVEKLSYREGLVHAEDGKQIVQELLTCVYQSTQNSGEVTRGAAAALAKHFGWI